MSDWPIKTQIESNIYVNVISGLKCQYSLRKSTLLGGLVDSTIKGYVRVNYTLRYPVRLKISLLSCVLGKSFREMLAWLATIPR